MDIRGIINSGKKYNFHAHTQFCDGRDTIADIAKAAVNEGFKHFGFTPHSPLIIESPCNMKAADIPAYRRAVGEAQTAAGTECKFYTGMEIDFLGAHHGPACEEFQVLNLDYSIGSVHFIPNQQGRYVDVDGRFESFRRKMAEDFNEDIRYVVETFYAQSCKMLELGGFDILGHFDKIGQNASYYSPGIEEEAWYKSLVNDYIRRIIDSKVIVEINTKARAEHGRFFPHERYWPRLVAANVALCVNSDAHYAARVDASRHEALSLLQNVR